MKRLIALSLFLVISLGLSGCNSRKYEDASALYGAGNYKEAIVLFRELGNYKDSAEKLKECYISIHGEDTYEIISSLEVGDTLEFGTFEQDNLRETTDEKIIWRVLDKRDSSIFLISDQILIYRCFHRDPSILSYRYDWNWSAIKKWLNNDFYSTVFTDAEKSLIVKSKTNTDTGTVFLLSKGEAEKYFPNWRVRVCSATKYAKALGNSQNSCVCDGVCYDNQWALRTIVENDNPKISSAEHLFLFVDEDGRFSDESTYRSLKGEVFETAHATGIRPAIWISLDA